MEKKLTLIESIGDFSWRLYGKIQNSANLVFSPSSIYIALAMTAIGGGGNTLEEFKKCLMFSDVEELANNLSLLQNHLLQKVDGLEIAVVNKIYLGLPQLKQEYTNLMTQNFKGALEQVNFSQNYEAVRENINQFVETVTQQKIMNLLNKGCLTSQTKMVLLNVIYFKGIWMHEFKLTDTHKEPFNLEYEQVGKIVNVNMMTIEEKFEYFENQHFQYIVLYYKDGKSINQPGPYKMEIILPRKSLEVFEQTNPLLALKEARAKKIKTKLILKLPQFSISGPPTASLKEVLSSLGINEAFSQQANLSFMDPNNSIQISDVIHKAMIEVNEKGTVAAAATAVVSKSRCRSIVLRMVCNKPFIYTISHSTTNTPLFIGKYTQPS